MGLQVDLVTCRIGSGEVQNIRQFAIKYYIHPDYIASTWNELNCWMRIPSHPNIVPFHGLVFDSVPTFPMNYDSVITHNKDKVVGFMTCFISGGTILDSISRPFRLTHLRQLIDVVDYLNFELGIVHGDITTYNLLIEPETDTLKIFDFNLASHLGDTEGDNSTRIRNIFSYEEERNDVKFTIFTLYEIITRDMHFREESYPHELDVATMLPAMWEKHPEVQLDAPVEEYRRVLDEWVKRREDVKDEITHWKQARSLLEWPPLPELDETVWCGELYRREYAWRQELDVYDLGYLNWQRPATCELPVLTPEGGGRRLLATGEFVDENGDAVDIGTQILSVEGGSEDGTSTVGKDSVDEEMTDTE